MNTSDFVRPKYTSASDPLSSSTNLLDRLCKYYLDCLGHDDQGGLRVFASSRYDDLDYAELPTFPSLTTHTSTSPIEDGVRTFLRRASRERNRLSLTLGYPVYLAKAKSRSGWEGFFVEPVFLFPCSNTEAVNVLPSVGEDPPDVNISALRSILGIEGSELVEEAVQLAEELGLHGQLGWGIEAMANALRSARPDWDWREDCDPTALQTAPPLKAIAERGIYNRAVLVLSERSPFTKGLEAELTKLRSLRPEAIERTALGSWLRQEIDGSGAITNTEPLLEPLPLNTEQRRATQLGLSQSLTVITGPPGTGKSQVVTSLLINAAWQGQTVLFASKNNKAVDVVETRVNSLGPRPILLRLGANQQQERLSEYLSSLLAATTAPSDQERYDELKQVHTRLMEQLATLDASLESTVNLRNSIDQLDQLLQEFRHEMGGPTFSLLRSFDPVRARADAATLGAAVRSATRVLQNPLVRFTWPLVRRGRHRALAQAGMQARELADQLKVAFPTELETEESVAAWAATAESFAERVEFAAKAHEYFDTLSRLSASQSPESVSEERLRATELVAANSASLWQTWLRLQPSRLTAPDRRALGEYAALVQMIARSRESGKTLAKQVFSRYYTLFPNVARQLSCWAVTSLSARGRIPLEAGFFDLLVIDEASQCDIASALPLLYRAKRAVIIGDPKQLRHISAIQESLDQRLLAKHHLFEAGGAAWSYATCSLYDRAVSLGEPADIVELRDHHRSHVDIIDFANRAFYESRLRIATRYDRLQALDTLGPAVRWIHVEGKASRPPTGGALNHVEAHAIVAELRRIVLEQRYRGSIGVVSPFRAQANRIRDLVTADDQLTQSLATSDFLVDTVHRFQGDERDLMIFSPALSSGMSDGAVRFLLRSPNLFNVAITRARAALVVVGDTAAAAKCDVSYLREFAVYVQQLGQRTNRNTQLGNDDHGPDYPRVSRPELVSEWEVLFYRAVYQAGFRPIPQYAEEKYILDFALFNGDRKLDIEVDGEKYHRRWDGEYVLRDQLRNQRLIELGWDVMRFWVYEVRDELDRCVSRVRNWHLNAR